MIASIAALFKVDAVLDSVVRVTQRIEIVVSTPAITDYRSAGFVPLTCDVHQCLGGSVRYGNKKNGKSLSTC